MQHVQETRRKIIIAKLGYLPPFYSLPGEEPEVCFPSAVLHLLHCQLHEEKTNASLATVHPFSHLGRKLEGKKYKITKSNQSYKY